MPELSIIIVSFNDEKFIAPCLKSILESSPALDFEIIIIDNASKIPSSEVLKDISLPNLTVIRNEINEGFARAANRGIKAASGDYYLLLNSDTVIYPGAFQRLLDFLKNHPDASCVGPLIHTPEGDIERSTHGFPSLIKEFFHSLPALKLLIPYKGVGQILSRLVNSPGSGSAGTYWNYDEVKVVENITGACMMVKKEAVEKVGLLDPNFFIYTEEVDWNYRFKQAGWKVYFTPEAEILHYFGQSTGQKPRAQKVNHVLLERYRGMMYFFRKHYGISSRIILRTIYLFAFALRILGAIFRLPRIGLKNFRREIKVFLKILKIAFFGPLTPTLPIKKIE